MSSELQAVAKSLGLDKYRRHIFLCAGQTEPKCAPQQSGLESWEYLKRRLKELGLAGPEPLVYRSRANCLRVCTQGPIAVVYPEAVWYHSCAPSVLERIIQEHLMHGKIVEEYAFANNAAFNHRSTQMDTDNFHPDLGQATPARQLEAQGLIDSPPQ